MSHFLTHQWTFYFILTNTGNPDSDGLHKLGRFETIEQFWALFRNIKRPSECPDIEIGVFSKNHILDKEDQSYKGGCLLQVPVPSDTLDYHWELLVMRAIGSQCDSSVVGISTMFSKGLFWIWCDNERLADFVEDEIVDVLGIDDDVKIDRIPIGE